MTQQSKIYKELKMQSEQQSKKDPQTQINQKLVQAIQNCDISKIKQLISAGADINYIKYTNENGWYRGDTNTPLSYAAAYNFKQQEQNKYIQMVEYLLENGADLDYRVRLGGWNGQNMYPIFGNLPSIISQFWSEKSKIKFIEILVKYGFDINQGKYRPNSRNLNHRQNSCLIFQLMSNCGLPSRINELRKMSQGVDFHRLVKTKEEGLRKRFNQQNKLPQEQLRLNPSDSEQSNQSDSEQISKDRQQNKQPQISLIKTLIDLGADISSSSSYYSRSNDELQQLQQQYQDSYSEHMSLRQDKRYKIFKQYYEEVESRSETLLHRFIMNNMTELVKLLIEKGVNRTNLAFTIDEPFYPHQWPEDLRSYKIEENMKNIKIYEKTKADLQERLQKCTNQEERNKLKDQIIAKQFLIFKAQRFSIQSEIPMKKYKLISITCIELAEKLNANPEIIRLLKYGIEGEEKVLKLRGRKSKFDSKLSEDPKHKRIIKQNKERKMPKMKLRNRAPKK